MDNSDQPKRRPGPWETAAIVAGFIVLYILVGAVTDLAFF